MSYTPPAGSAADFTWLGESAYTPPAGNAVDFTWVEPPPPPPPPDVVGGHYGAWWADKYQKMFERKPKAADTQQDIEKLEETLEEVEQEIAEVKSKPIPSKPIVIKSTPIPSIEAQAKILEALIFQRARLLESIDEEEALMLLM